MNRTDVYWLPASLLNRNRLTASVGRVRCSSTPTSALVPSPVTGVPAGRVPEPLVPIGERARGVRGWAAYYRTEVSKEVFSALRA